VRARLAAALLALVFATTAQAQSANRAWVSGKGTDAPGCGAPTNACRSFQYTHDHIVAAGGEIDVLDGAGYGAVTITKALGIVAVGAVAAVQQPARGLSAITINAGANDAVQLRGLTLDGLELATIGIAFNSGASLAIVNCVTRHFVVSGISIGSTTFDNSATITDTQSSDNFIGINVSAIGTTRVAMKRVRVDNNTDGVQLHPASVATIQASAVDSEASGNTNVGFLAVADELLAVASLSLRNVTVTGNRTGIETTGTAAGATAQIALGHSLVAYNSFAGADTTFGGTIYSYGDNRFGLNATTFLTPIAAK